MNEIQKILLVEGCRALLDHMNWVVKHPMKMPLAEQIKTRAYLIGEIRVVLASLPYSSMDITGHTKEWLDALLLKWANVTSSKIEKKSNSWQSLIVKFIQQYDEEKAATKQAAHQAANPPLFT